MYRCKGIVFADDDPAQPFVLQVVGRRTEFVASKVDVPVGRTEIVAIGRNVNADELTSQYVTTLTH